LLTGLAHCSRWTPYTGAEVCLATSHETQTTVSNSAIMGNARELLVVWFNYFKSNWNTYCHCIEILILPGGKYVPWSILFTWSFTWSVTLNHRDYTSDDNTALQTLPVSMKKLICVFRTLSSLDLKEFTMLLLQHWTVNNWICWSLFQRRSETECL